MSRFACMIDAATPDSYPLANGAVAGFWPLLDPKFDAWRPDDRMSEPARVHGMEGENLRVGPHVLNREIFEIVEEMHGSCTWAYSLFDVEAFDSRGEPTISPILWAWSADGALRAIVATCVRKDSQS